MQKYFNESLFPIESTNKANGVTISHGNIPLLYNYNNIIRNDINYKWEKTDIILLISKISKWWHADKKYLLHKETNDGFGSITEEFKIRFETLKIILSYIIAPFYSELEKNERSEIDIIINELPNFKLSNITIRAALYNVYPQEQIELKSLMFENLFSYTESDVIDSLDGILILLDISPDASTEFITAICENIRSVNKIAVNKNIEIITLIVSDYPTLINNRMLKDLEIGLSNLIKYTSILSNDSSDIINNKLLTKFKSAKLSLALNKYYNSTKTKTPKVIIGWKNSCLNPNEFSEIRKIWIDG